MHVQFHTIYLHHLHTPHIPYEAMASTIAFRFQFIISTILSLSFSPVLSHSRSGSVQSTITLLGVISRSGLQSTGPWKMSLMWPCSPVNQVPQKGQAAWKAWVPWGSGIWLHPTTVFSEHTWPQGQKA